MMTENRRGRPATFSSDERRRLAELIRVHGARPAMEMCAVPISLQTVLKIAREFNIELKKGRRPKRAA